MQALTAFTLALALAFSMPYGMAASNTKINVVTTTTDLKSLVTSVGGDRVTVESIAAPDQDPHSMELKPIQLVRLRDADLVVRIGMDHEPWLARMSTKAQVLNTSNNVQLIQTETPRLRAERRAHVHAYGNTHYWLDPENARPITASITETLSKLRPLDRHYFEANREKFLHELDVRLKAWKIAMEPYRGTKVVVMHDSWSYFAKRFGLSIVAAAEPTPGVPPSPAELSKLFVRMRDAGVKIVIADPNSNPGVVRQVAEHGGARAVTLVPSVLADPLAKDYLSMFDLNVERFVGGLR